MRQSSPCLSLQGNAIVKVSYQGLPTFQYLARDPGSSVADQLRMHELPSGYNFVPLQQAGSAETDDPGLIRDWKKSTFQGRSVSYFVYKDKTYGLAIAVDGQALRAQHYVNLRRKGESFDSCNPGCC